MKMRLNIRPGIKASLLLLYSTLWRCRTGAGSAADIIFRGKAEGLSELGNAVIDLLNAQYTGFGEL